MAFIIQVATSYIAGVPFHSDVCGNRVPKIEGYTDKQTATLMVAQAMLVKPKNIDLVHILLSED